MFLLNVVLEIDTVPTLLYIAPPPSYSPLAVFSLKVDPDIIKLFSLNIAPPFSAVLALMEDSSIVKVPLWLCIAPPNNFDTLSEREEFMIDNSPQFIIAPPLSPPRNIPRPNDVFAYREDSIIVSLPLLYIAPPASCEVFS